MSQLAGRVALVTGGGTGIGRGVAIALAEAGARVVICGRRQEPLGRVVGQITAGGGQARAVEADVAAEADVARLAEEAIAAFGHIDILVNNAGIGGGGEVHEHNLRDWDAIMAVDLRGPFLVARAVLPGMRERRAGHIVNISSESGIEHYAGDGAYGVAKHALNALGEYLQRENQDYGIRVNTICPGMVVTEMTEKAQGLDQSKCLYPEDIADLVLWLVTRRPNIKIGLPILIQTMENPWAG
jgi:NAD(P)-dependent dehydrogenase (short-subunit alcohol dehydrogenase family)